MSVSPQTYETQTDSAGNFSYEIFNTISPGLHTLQVQDESGNSKEVGIYVVKDSGANLINRVTTVMPLGYAYAAIIWLVLFLILLFDILRLSLQVDVISHKKRPLYYRHALYFSAAAVIVISLVGVIVNNKTRIFNGLLGSTGSNQHALVKVSGAVLDPMTLQGVGGVDLTSLNSTIHTAPGGMYAFDDVDAYQGIRINHPILQRAILILVSNQKTDARFDLYFDPKMYNTLNSFIVAMVQKKWGTAYSYLSGVSREKISLDNLSKVATIFKEENLSDQELTVSNVELLNEWFSDAYQVSFKKVVKITAVDDSTKEDFYLIKEGTEWKIIK